MQTLTIKIFAASDCTVKEIKKKEDLLQVIFCKPLIFQIMNYIRSNSLSLKYQRFTPSNIEVRKLIRVCGKNSLSLKQTKLNTVYFSLS